MPAILTNSLSVINAENFVDSFVNGDSNIYMGVGRGYEEGDSIGTSSKDDYNKWTDKNDSSINESNPPVPVDSIEKQKEFRDGLLGIKRVQINDITIMVPRVDWIAGKRYNVLNESDKLGIRATDYYCINENNEVWLCVNAPTDKTVTASIMPSFNSLKLESGSTNENIENNVRSFIFKENTSTNCYWWKYLYTIPTSIANKKLLDGWMPVLFSKHGIYLQGGGTLGENQYMYGDVNANRTLGAYRVMLTCTLGDEDTVIPYDSIYRQVGLIVDPTEIKQSVDTPAARLTGDLFNEDEFDKYSGELVYLENKKPVHREHNQTETLRLFLVF